MKYTTAKERKEVYKKILSDLESILQKDEDYEDYDDYFLCNAIIREFNYDFHDVRSRFPELHYFDDLSIKHNAWLSAYTDDSAAYSEIVYAKRVIENNKLRAIVLGFCIALCDKPL